ncbi:hypothetical protein TNCV_4962631, partial [Trichonephila clavipes]
MIVSSGPELSSSGFVTLIPAKGSPCNGDESFLKPFHWCGGEARRGGFQLKISSSSLNCGSSLLESVPNSPCGASQ